MAGIVKLLRKGEDLIRDWKWRPTEAVRKDLGDLKRVDPYITENYGAFMKEQADRAARGELTPRDAVKAYTITRSSVNRAGRNVNDDLARGVARPEGYFSEWLLSPQGQRYLDDAMKGKANEGAIADITQRFTPFGMASTLGNDLRVAALRSGELGGERLNKAVLGGPDEWRAYAQGLPGIGPAKSGFIASLLGRGDMPTLDARQLVLQTGEPAKASSKFMARGKGRGGDAGVDRLAARQSELGFDLPRELEPFRQHLSHHAIWDKVGGSQTTHEDLIRAMQRGKADPRLLGGLSAAAALTVAGLRDYTKGE